MNATETNMNRITVKQLAKSIIEDIRADEVLLNCVSFSELHNYCDANMLGLTNEVCDQHEDFSEAINIINRAQNLVNRYMEIYL